MYRPTPVLALSLLFTVGLFTVGFCPATANAGKPKAVGDVGWAVRISQDAGGFEGTLASGDSFGRSVTPLGDVDGDGVIDLAVGAHLSDDGGDRRGSVWILFMNEDGTVRDTQEISDTQGNFFGSLDNLDWLGVAVCGLGDLDGDGIPDLAAGTALDDDGGTNKGAVWVLFLNANGTVKTYQKISDTQGSFFGSMWSNGWFGTSLANLGDLNDDGRLELAVGAYREANVGAVWILSLNTNGTVNSFVRISSFSGGFSGSLGNLGEFGHSITPLGDVDGDGVTDIAIGARRDCDGGGPPCNLGAAWVLLLNANGTVKSQQKIGNNTGGLGDVLNPYAFFGASVAGLGDLDGDGTPDLAVGSQQDDDGGNAGDDNANYGAVFLLFLNSDGTVRTYRKISDTHGNFDDNLDQGDNFALSLANLGDLDGDGVIDLAAGAEQNGPGALWTLGLSNKMGFSKPFPPKSAQGMKLDVDLSPIGGTAPYTVDLKKGSLPPGVTLDQDGELSGSPTKKGTYKFTLRITDSTAGPSGPTVAETKVVHSVVAKVKLATKDLGDGKHGKSYQATVKAKAGVGPYTFNVSSGTLPSGLYLDTNKGRIEGTPDSVGPATFTIEVEDSLGGVAARDFAIQIKPTLKITTSALDNGKVDKPYSFRVKGKGGIKNYNFSISAGALPGGLSIANDGTISGTPTTKEKPTFTVQILDDSGETVEKVFSLKIK